MDKGIKMSLNSKSLSWFDSLPLEIKEDLLREAGRSYFTFEELAAQYVTWLEARIFKYEKIIQHLLEKP